MISKKKKSKIYVEMEKSLRLSHLPHNSLNPLKLNHTELPQIQKLGLAMKREYESDTVRPDSCHWETDTVANRSVLGSSTSPSAASGSVPPSPPTYASSPLLRALLGFTPRHEETPLCPSPTSAASSPENDEDLFAEEIEEIEKRQEDQFSDPEVERGISAIKAVSDVAYDLHDLFTEAEDNDYPLPLLHNLFMEPEEDGYPPPLLHDISMKAEDVQWSLPQGWNVEPEDVIPSLPQGWIVEADGAPPPVNHQHVIDVEDSAPPQDMDEAPVPLPRERFSVLWLWEEAINVDNLVLIYPDGQYLLLQWLLSGVNHSSCQMVADASCQMVTDASSPMVTDAIFNPVFMGFFCACVASFIIMYASTLAGLRVVTLCGLPLTVPRVTIPGSVELVAVTVNGFFACLMIINEVGILRSIASRAIFGYCVRVIKKVAIRFLS